MRQRLSLRPVVTVLCLATLFGPVVASAQQKGKKFDAQKLQQRMQQQQRWWQDESVATELGLTDGQLQRLDDMGDRYRQHTQAARRDGIRAYRAFMEALSDYGTSDETIHERRLALEAVRAEIASMALDQLLEVRAILGQEQWEMLPQVAPRVLRVGQTSWRGGGMVTLQDEAGADEP